MALKVNFEIGHVASIRTKKTPEGFTHDWEVYVRGADNTDISHYVDKVIFILHDTFIKPKRVIKDQPYAVKESGYAGFNFPIEIHLKNRDEPKIINFNYDLQLQPSGPTINKLRKEKYVFPNPSDEFKKKLIKGGATLVSSANPYFISSIEQERNSRDSFTDEKPAQLIGKPKLGGDNIKKHKQKDYRMEDLPRASNSYVNIFGSPIHLPSRISPDPKKPSPNSKIEKKDKDKPYSDRDKQKLKHDAKEHKEEKKTAKEEKDKSKIDKKSKPHKVRDLKEKKNKRPADKLPSPSPPAKRPATLPIQSPRRGPSPNNKSNSSASSKEEVKPTKHPTNVEIKSNTLKMTDPNLMKMEKKMKREKKSYDKEREMKKDRENKTLLPENKDINKSKESVVRNLNPIKEKEKPPTKPINKFSIENMLKDPSDAVKISDPTKHKGKTDRERKHKHKKKDKKRDESRDKSKDPCPKEKKHKHDKHKEKSTDIKESIPVPEKIESTPAPREIDKSKNFKEKDRSQLTISPISLDTSSQSSSKSASKSSSTSKNPLSSMIDALPELTDSEPSTVSEDEDNSFNINNNRNIKKPTEQPKLSLEPIKTDKQPDKMEKISPGPSHRIPKKEKPSKQDIKEEKKQRKRKSNSKEESDGGMKIPKLEDADHKVKRPDLMDKMKSESSRSRSDTKVQDDGVSSSLSDNPLKCESPATEEDTPTIESNEISSDYMVQLRELQHKIMTIQSNEELERVVNLIAETGKYEVTKKTFDFDLCLLDRTTVQQLQELIGCESRA